MVLMQRMALGVPAGGRGESGWSLDFTGVVPIKIAMAIALALAALSAVVPPVEAGPAVDGPSVSVVVRAVPGSAAVAESLVRSLGGTVDRELRVIDGFAATVPAAGVAVVRKAPSVVSATTDSTLRPMTTTWSAAADLGSMYNVTQITGAQAMWQAGWTGRGIDIAVIDSGVVPVDGLAGKIINGPDLSFETLAPGLRYLDTYGHGTHIAGIIAGRSSGAVAGRYAGDSTHFLGMAPDSRIVSVKVADDHGATDVSQVIAAIDWVVQHRNDHGLNIRVLNLSYGTDSTQDPQIDPLAYAAEVAWHKGIVVVVAAGNAGYAPAGSLTDPATDPFVIAVGSSETNGTASMIDDTVSSFSSSSIWNAHTNRLVDLVAPGAHIVSLRDPGSYIDRTYSATGAVTPGLFRGSGTSQSAAVVSGAAALVLQQRPTLTPDEVKRLLTYSASTIQAQAVSQGNGELNLRTGLAWPNSMVLGFVQYWTPGTGTGSLDASRGSNHLVQDHVALQSDVDVFGHRFASASMAGAEAAGNSWSGGSWNGNSWSGNSWSGNSWSGNSWSGNSWSGNSWSSYSWSGNSWSGNSWSSDSWSGNSWSGNSWSGNDWAGNSWSGNSWSGFCWK
jgi:serine protease AprX